MFLVTSKGPGTAVEFSLILVQILWDYEKAKKIADAMLFKTFDEQNIKNAKS